MEHGLNATSVEHQDQWADGSPLLRGPRLSQIGWLADNTVVQQLEALLGPRADLGVVLAVMLALPILRGLLDVMLFKPLGRLLILGNFRKAPNVRERSVIVKCQESSWKACVYLSMALLAFAATDTRWLKDTRMLWTGCTMLPCEHDAGSAVRWVYVIEMGFYAQAIPSLIFWEVRRKDFLESLAHHIATLILICYSYWLNLTRVGVLIVMLHDVNDIFLELAKLARYTGRDLLPNALFVVFLLSWIASRLMVFPFWVIRSVLVDAKAVALKYNVNLHPHYEIFSGFLLFLLGLHIYWTWLIIKVLSNVVTGNHADDVREDDDDHED